MLVEQRTEMTVILSIGRFVIAQFQVWLFEEGQSPKLNKTSDFGRFQTANPKIEQKYRPLAVFELCSQHINKHFLLISNTIQVFNEYLALW